ncbi:MAG: guanylate kinase [Brevinema sp.]
MDQKVIVISGPSGVGKTTLYKKVLAKYQDQLDFCISATTRPKRSSEIDGRDYHFISEEEFHYLVAAGKFIEWEQLYNYCYGTLWNEMYRIWETGKQCLLDIDVKGGINIHDMFHEQSSLIFIAPPCMQELESRLRLRGENDESSLNKRLSIASEEMSHQSKYDYVIVNEDFDKTLEQLCDIIDSILAK